MVNELQAAAVIITAVAGFGALVIIGEVALVIDGYLYSRKLKREFGAC